MISTPGLERWSGKVALVTGASSGIGAAVATALYESGMRVAVCARRLQRLQALGEGWDAERFLARGVDLRDPAGIAALFAAVRGRWGGVDVLVNNAGLGHAVSLVGEDGAGGVQSKVDAWREMLDVNVLGLSVCTTYALSDMRREDRGHVIHISSMAAHRVPPQSGMYAATKHAVRALTEALRQELRTLGSGIRVSSISPGYVETEFAEVFHDDPAAAQQTYGRYTVLQPTDVAATVLHLLAQPEHVQIHDVLMRSTPQPL